MMTTNQLPAHLCTDLVTELVGALYDCSALDHIGPDRLAALATAVSPLSLGPLADFAFEVRTAWEMARPMTDDDIAELAEAFGSEIEWYDPEGFDGNGHPIEAPALGLVDGKYGVDADEIMTGLAIDQARIHNQRAAA